MGKPNRPKKVKKLNNLFSPPAPTARAQIRTLAHEKIEHHVVEALSADPSPMTVVRLGLQAVRNCEGVSEGLLQEFQPTLACHAGCDYCCYPPVAATVPEVANIVAFVETQLSSEEGERLRSRVSAVKQETAHLTGAQRASISLACPYLEQGRCSVYPVRPLACRGFNSYDESVCREVFEHPKEPPKVPSFTPLIASSQGMKEGMASGLLRRGLSTPVVDLVKASDKLFQELDETLEEWLRGQDVFSDCQPF